MPQCSATASTASSSWPLSSFSPMPSLRYTTPLYLHEHEHIKQHNDASEPVPSSGSSHSVARSLLCRCIRTFTAHFPKATARYVSQEGGQNKAPIGNAHAHDHECGVPMRCAALRLTSREPAAPTTLHETCSIAQARREWVKRC